MNYTVLTTLVQQTPMFLQVHPNIIPGALNYRRATRLDSMGLEELRAVLRRDPLA